MRILQVGDQSDQYYKEQKNQDYFVYVLSVILYACQAFPISRMYFPAIHNNIIGHQCNFFILNNPACNVNLVDFFFDIGSFEAYKLFFKDIIAPESVGCVRVYKWFYLDFLYQINRLFPFLDKVIIDLS